MKPLLLKLSFIFVACAGITSIPIQAQEPVLHHPSPLIEAEGHWHIGCISYPPVNLFADSIRSTSAILHASLNISTRYYTTITFKYKAVTGTTWVMPLSSSMTPEGNRIIGINHLIPGTTYEFIAVAKCTNIYGSIPRSSASAYFTTLKPGEHPHILSYRQLVISPNPVSTIANISFILSMPVKVSVKVFDSSGKLVTIIADRQMTEGIHLLTWNANSMNIITGTYYLRFTAGNDSETRNLSVFK